jgi:hypothetical protein
MDGTAGHACLSAVILLTNENAARVSPAEVRILQ